MFQITTVNNNNNYSTNSNNQQNQQNQQNNQTNTQMAIEEPKKYKSIIELQKEIKHYKNKERTYKLQLIEKQNKINELKELKSLYENINKSHKEQPKNLFKKDDLYNIKIQNLLLALKKIIKDKNSILLSLEEDLYSSSPQAVKFFTNQLRYFQKENIEIYACVQGSSIDNFKKENSNEKNQLNALLVKIAECQENINDLLKNLDEMNDTASFLKRKENK